MSNPEVWIQLFGGQGSVLLLFLFYENVSGLQPRACLSSQPSTRQAPWVFLCIASHFLAGNMEAELKPTNFSSFLLFCVFLFSQPPAI